MGAKRRDRRKIISLLAVAVLAGGLGTLPMPPIC